MKWCPWLNTNILKSSSIERVASAPAWLLGEAAVLLAAVLCWAGLGWARLDWAGLGWAGLQRLPFTINIAGDQATIRCTSGIFGTINALHCGTWSKEIKHINLAVEGDYQFLLVSRDYKISSMQQTVRVAPLNSHRAVDPGPVGTWLWQGTTSAVCCSPPNKPPSIIIIIISFSDICTPSPRDNDHGDHGAAPAQDGAPGRLRLQPRGLQPAREVKIDKSRYKIWHVDK